MLTEEEAKTKWCPAVRVTAENDRCIGSACMAWRTVHQWLDNAQQEPRWVDYEPYAFTPGAEQERNVGYCGLVGRP